MIYFFVLSVLPHELYGVFIYDLLTLTFVLLRLLPSFLRFSCSMHRVSVFRDDVVFVIYMVQRRIYPIDTERPAEGYDDGDNSNEGNEGAAGGAAK
jgi:hypothetical protein